MEQEEQRESFGDIEKSEVIFVETEDYSEGRDYGGFQKEFKRSFEKVEGRSYPLSVRFVCLFCALILLFFLLAATPFVLFFTAVNLFTFFQWEGFAVRTKLIWSTFIKMLVVAIGLLAAVISPALGISLIMVYFMTRGQKSDGIWVQKIFRSGTSR